MSSEMLRRIDRIESRLAIGQLPVRYAMAIDGRDVDTWLSLFVDDVHCGAAGKGREALLSIITPALQSFYRSIHYVCGHEIDFVDDDHATGRVYCRAEHEDRGQWIVMAICYFDEYERRDGEWFFTRRRERHWYSVDALERPGVPFQRWPGHDSQPRLPAAFPSWAAFWSDVDQALVSELTKEPVAAANPW